MVLDLCAFDSGIRNEVVLIRGRSWRDVRPFASEFSPSSVGVLSSSFPSRWMTSANSDGGLPFDRKVPDSRGEELCDVDQ